MCTKLNVCWKYQEKTSSLGMKLSWNKKSLSSNHYGLSVKYFLETAYSQCGISINFTSGQFVTLVAIEGYLNLHTFMVIWMHVLPHLSFLWDLSIMYNYASYIIICAIIMVADLLRYFNPLLSIFNVCTQSNIGDAFLFFLTAPIG